MTDCPNGEIRDLLPDLLHDRLAPDVRRDVDAHVRGCAQCRDELALLRSMRASLQRAPAVNAAALAAAIPAYRAPARRSWGGWRAAAAIVILAAGGTSVAVLQQGDPVFAVVGDSAPRVASATAPTTVPVPDGADSAVQEPAPGTARELALGSSVVGDLDDGELSTLLNGLRTIDALPSAEVENSTTVSPVSPTGTD